MKMDCGTVDGNFHFSPRLPVEIRLAIWREYLPHRVVDRNAILGSAHGSTRRYDAEQLDKLEPMSTQCLL